MRVCFAQDKVVVLVVGLYLSLCLTRCLSLCVPVLHIVCLSLRYTVVAISAKWNSRRRWNLILYNDLSAGFMTLLNSCEIVRCYYVACIYRCSLRWRGFMRSKFCTQLPLSLRSGTKSVALMFHCRDTLCGAFSVRPFSYCVQWKISSALFRLLYLIWSV